MTEYDIVFDEVRSTHDRAVIYLPEAMNDGTALTAGNCWDTGARLQFKFSNNNKWYFQTQNGDGQNKDNAVYFPMKDDELKKALDAGQKVDRLLEFDENEIYHVRTEMDTATDTTQGNVKIYITDPEGIEHEVTKEGGNGFRIYPKDGIIKNFAAVRGGYTLINHKVSWISGYATKKVETYLKAENAADYTKENSDIITKEIPENIKEHQPDANIVRNNQSYVLDAEKSGWYDGDSKVTSLNAAAGGTYTYRAYYQFENVDKGALNKKIEEAEKLIQNDYTATSWKVFSDALTKAQGVNEATSASQEAVNFVAGELDTAQGSLISVKSLRDAIANCKEKLKLEEKEEQKDDYVNWKDVQDTLNEAEKILNKPNATKEQVEEAVDSLKDLALVTKAEAELETAKKEMADAVTAANQQLGKLKEADYTPASWKAVKDAIEACEKLNPETAGKDDYDTKTKVLKDALENLAKLADKAALNQVIAAAEAKKEADYESGYKEMQQALAAARDVAGNANATQTEVDAAKNKLQNAINNLKAKSAKTTDVKVNSIKPAAKTYKIAAGKKLDLKKVFTALPEDAANRNMTYSIDARYSKYASINKSGVVTVKKSAAGKTVVVKATAADGSNTSATIKIKIMKNAVTKITVKKKSLTVKAGKKVTIKPAVKTNGKSVNKTLEYTSSNEKLAKVSRKGVVTTKKGKTGKVTITIKSTDGTNKSAKVKITIKK